MDSPEQEHNAALPAVPPATVEVDTYAFENDSSYGDEISNFTASITASAVDYRNENGRRYHAFRDGRYLIPNDEPEKQRLDTLHMLYRTLTGGRLFLSPLPPAPHRILDLGTGTGSWAIDFADDYPSTEVWGNDLSPIQPAWIPPNVRFVIDDFEDEWLYGHRKFDFIHARYLAVSCKDFPRLIRRCYEFTTPGGYVEFQDWDANMYSQDGSTEGTSIKQYYDVIRPAFAKAEVECSPGSKLEGWFRDAGFEDIHVQKFLVPMGGWPKDETLKSVGFLNLMQIATGFEATALAVLTRHEGWSKEAVADLVARTRQDAWNPSIHAIFDFYIVYGRKPA
ncbi:hypothetical protein DTO217A2_2451 [Paecilomyces variotii]|nr:hypothetical protein DTO217A2_2451 [Paecilomyces variotii]